MTLTFPLLSSDNVGTVKRSGNHYLKGIYVG